MQGASKSLVLLVTELGEELKGSSEAKVVSIVEDFEHQIDGLGIKVCPPSTPASRNRLQQTLAILSRLKAGKHCTLAPLRSLTQSNLPT